MSGVWTGTTFEYGSGTPLGHGDSDAHAASEDEDGHAHVEGSGAARVPSHAAVSLSAGIDLLRGARGRARLALRVDVENISNHIYRIAQDNEFSPGQFSIPRLVSFTARLRF